jgi:hypothetical protein
MRLTSPGNRGKFSSTNPANPVDGVSGHSYNGRRLLMEMFRPHHGVASLSTWLNPDSGSNMKFDVRRPVGDSTGTSDHGQASPGLFFAKPDWQSESRPWFEERHEDRSEPQSLAEETIPSGSSGGTHDEYHISVVSGRRSNIRQNAQRLRV